MPEVTYESQKAKFRVRIEAYLKDCARTEDGVSTTDLKQILHLSSASAFLRVILADLEREGLIDTNLVGGNGVVYFTKLWKEKYNDGEADKAGVEAV